MDNEQSDQGAAEYFQEIVKLELNDLVRLLPKYIYHSIESKSIQSISDDLQGFKIKDVSEMTEEMSLIHLIERDKKEQLICQSQILFEEALHQDSTKAPNQDFENKENRDPNITRPIHHKLALRLLHLCCKYDSVECAKSLIEGEVGTGLDLNEIDESGRTALHTAAETHAKKCIKLLLSNQARTDIRSTDGNSQLALEKALSSQRMKAKWTVEDTVEDLLVFVSGMELSAIRMLVEKTTDIAEVAYASAMEGRVVSLAALLSIAPEQIIASIMVHRPDEATTIYECVIREALSLGQKEASRGARRLALSNSEKRKLLLCEIELLQLFEATIPERGCTDRRVVSPLIRAAQAGDEEVIELLLKTKIEVNETDGEGNSALHWYLKTSSNTKKPRILLLLLKHGANVRQRNRLGLTPLHVAAAKGYYQALQVLLLQDAECVDAVSEMRETPLFFAVKNDFMNCAKLLLRHGANTQLLNLRKQRPIDLAKSQDMRFLLSQMSLRFWSGADPITQESANNYSLQDDQSDSDGEMFQAFVNDQVDSTSNERSYPGAKTQICRYFESPGGCARGAKCYYAHGEEELKQGGQTSRSLTMEELKRKIFIGGLPASVDSGTLRELFDYQFGSVEEAIVIGSQAGDHVLSRGFGFVTFKTEESVAAAVHAHYVMILGKKVEIKGATPKPKLLPETPKATPKQLQYNLQVLSPNGRQKGEIRRLESMSWLDLDATSSDQNNLPSWVNTFKKWLPGFLYDVSKRLKEGEWYPLSSLKGDFRATCGLELDHVSLGYMKLSDFMRSFPGICRMKVVPVSGRGPATHMVLLPNLPSSPQQHQYQFLPIEDPSIPSKNIFSTKQKEPSSMEYSNPPLLDENDDDDDLRLIESLISSAVNFGHSSGEGTSYGSGREEVQKGDDTTGVDQIIVTGEFSEPTQINVQTPKRRCVCGRAEGCTGGDDLRREILRALNKEKVGFSLFARQFDFFQSYREHVAKQTCFRCKKKKILWYCKPCGHPCWCSGCKQWAIIHGASGGHCVVCDSAVEGYGFKAWGSSQQELGPSNNNQPQPESTLNNEDFPPWDSEAVRVRSNRKWYSKNR